MYIRFNEKQIKRNEMFHINNIFIRQNGHEMIDPGSFDNFIRFDTNVNRVYLQIHLHCSSA